MTEPIGVPRTDPFLVLDDDGYALRTAIIDEVNRRYNEAPTVRDRMEITATRSNPRVGELALELTRASWSKERHIRTIGLGYLVAVHGQKVYVQCGPDPEDVAEWENCVFVRVDPDVVRAVLEQESK